MIDKFEQLDEEKQDDIRRSALSIFAEKGYKDASTNKIVEAAEISKGTLFYYFKNKRNFYYYLIDYALEIIKLEYLEHMDYTTSDFIERMANNSRIKYMYFQKHPEANAFLSTVLYKEFTDLPTEYQQKFQVLIQTSKEKLNEQKEIQTDLFKKEIDAEKATWIIELAIEGYFSQLAEQFRHNILKDIDLKHLWAEFDDLLNTLRGMFYKDFEEEN